MIVRNEQMKTFRNASAGAFEQQMVEHLTNFARVHAESIGEKMLQQLVHLGVERAELHGWTQKGPVEFYLELMVMLGADFDTDPQYPWISEILDSKKDQMFRADWLHSEAMKYYKAVFGPALEYEIQAIRRQLEAWDNLASRLAKSNGAEMVQVLQWAYPEKAAFLGAETLQKLVQCGGDLSARHGVSEPIGIALLTGLLFTFGHGCCTDPQYSWIAAAIKPPHEKRVEHLKASFKKYLEQALIQLQRS